MPRLVVLPSSVSVLFSIALVSLGACGDGETAEPKSRDEAPAKGASAEPEGAPGKPEGASAGPSNTPAQTWTQAWATPTGQATGHVAAVQDGRIYAIAGAFMEFGTPATHLVCLAEDSGEILWTFEGDGPLSLEGASASLLDVGTASGSIVIVSAETGEKTKPTKAESDATKPVDGPAAEGCEAKDKTLSCAGWTVEEGGAVSKLTRSGEQVCYAVAGSREVRCRAAETGDLALAVAVPAVADVKDPDAVNFSFHLVGERLIVGNYDGAVLAYAPGSGGPPP